MLKRAFDLFWAAVGICLLWPLFLVVGLLIKIEDGGPIYFRQWRIGLHGKPFRILKFRTMVSHAEQKGMALTVGRDARITKIGHWLRGTKIDELPQLMNVLKGEMSFVGPRPEVQKYVDLYSTEQGKVLELMPGITDLASVKYRRESELLGASMDPNQTYIDEIMPEKIRINLQYASQANLWRDVRVILLTLGVYKDDR